METNGTRTVCAFCHAGCGMVVYTKGNEVERVTGDPDHPVGQGALCPKGMAVPELLSAPDRVTAPLLKTSAGFKTISWDEALSFIAERLEDLKSKHGPQNLVRFRGAPISDTVRDAFHQFLAAYGSTNTSGISHLCSTPERVGFQLVFGERPNPDYEGTRLVILWGSNTEDSHQYGDGGASYQGFNPLRRCKQKGARLIVIDPRKTETARHAHQWVPIRPGSDLALALAMSKIIIDEGLYDSGFIRDYTTGFDRFRAHLETITLEWAQENTGIPEGQIRDLAHEYASTKPALIVPGNGLNMHANVVQTTRSIAFLMVLSGNIDIPGGNVFFPHVPQAPWPTAMTDIPAFGRSEYPLYPFTPFPTVLDALSQSHEVRPRALIVYHSNPALVNANEEKVHRALSSLDLMVVVDLFMTKTAEMAHLVLPDTSAWETWGYRVYSTREGAFVTLCPPVIEPRGLCRPALEVEWELASRMGLEEFYPWNDTKGWIDYKLKPAGVSFDRLREEKLIYVTPPLTFQKYRDKKFATSSGKVEFFSDKLQQSGCSPLPAYKQSAAIPTSDYPLRGTTRKPGAYVHTQFRNLPSLRKREPEERIRIHPEDAMPRQIKEGDMVKIKSPLGTLCLKAKVTEEVCAGVVVIDFGWGNPGDGWENVNRLAEDLPRDSISCTTPNREFICEVWKN